MFLKKLYRIKTRQGLYNLASGPSYRVLIHELFSMPSPINKTIQTVNRFTDLNFPNDCRVYFFMHSYLSSFEHFLAMTFKNNVVHLSGCLFI